MCASINKSGTTKQKEQSSYAKAGVDIDTAKELVADIKSIVQSTARPGAQARIGSFGGLFDLAKLKYKDPILVSGTDGVGTKLKLAQQVEQHDTIGIDLVAMCVNDLLTHGAEPLFFLDYIATGILDKKTAHIVISGIVNGCKQAGTALIGGETAEMPGMYAQRVYDIAGFAVGIVEREQLLPKKDVINKNDLLLGLASSGLHSNGFSLVRYLIDKLHLDIYAVPPFNSDKKRLYQELLEPTKIYVLSVLPLMQQGYVKAAAHITGGGLVENIPRMLPDHLDYQLDQEKWPTPTIFEWLAHIGNIKPQEMRRTFNMGIGFVLVVSQEYVRKVMKNLEAAGEQPYVIGRCIKK